MLLRKALEDCEACKIKKPECTDIPYPCFEGPPRVDCRDTVDGTQCGPCPPGYKVEADTYLIFVNLVRRHIIKACKKYTKKHVNSQQNSPNWSKWAKIGQNFVFSMLKSTPA